ncbi:MAG: HAD family phosphatase [Lachnospiraceae bacterium]|nr:HAD family phosphatase [Lachnospiraceae bacterium]
MDHDKAVVFDMDGVIFDSELLVLNCWREIAGKYGLTDIEITCRECTGTNADVTREIFRKYYGKDVPYDEYKAEVRELFSKSFGDGRKYLKPGVTELLKKLKDNGYKVALASSTRRVTVEKELRSAGIIGFFDEIICGDMVKMSKPHPEIFQTACKRLCVREKDTFAVEDSINGIKSAYNAKMRVIMVPDLIPATDEIREIAEAILPDLLSVGKYILEDN